MNYTTFLNVVTDSDFLSVLIGLAIVVVLFIVLRNIILWYYKIDVIARNLEGQSNLQYEILNELKKIATSSVNQDDSTSIYLFDSKISNRDTNIEVKINNSGNFIELTQDKLTAREFTVPAGQLIVTIKSTNEILNGKHIFLTLESGLKQSIDISDELDNLTL